MNCKTCQYWRMPDKGEYFGAMECAAPRNPIDNWEYITDANEQIKFSGYATAYCTHPNLKFYERPDKNGACVADGSEYKAVLITGEDFFCNMHSLKEK